MKNKKILALISFILLCTVAVFSLFMAGAAENFDLTVYISASGNGENSGLTESSPVSTLAEALTVAKGEAIGSSAKVHFVLLSDLQVSDDPYGNTPFNFDLTVSGKNGTEAFIAKGTYVHHMGNTRYENMHFTQASSTNYSFLCGNGYDLVMGEGLSCTPSSKGYYLNLAGGVHGNKSKNFISDSSLTVLSGQWETLYAGSYKENQKGNATLYAENCQVYTNVGTCYTEDHKGTSTITLKNCEIAIKSTGMLQGGPTNAAGSLSDKLTLTVENCTVRDFGVGFKCPITAPLSLSVKNSVFQAAYSVTATGEKEITLSATEGKTLDLTPATAIECTNFIGGGTLVLGSESTLTAESVSGSTALSLGASPALRAYVQAPKDTPDNAFTYSKTPTIKTRISGNQKIWTLSSAVILKAPASVTLTLSTGFSGGEKVTADSVSTTNGVSYHTFYGLSAGNYRYNVKGSGYYQITKNLYLSAEKLADDYELDCTPPRLAGTGFEPNTANPNVKDYTDEMRENILNDNPDNWEEYQFIFNTPYFTRDSYEAGLHQATTQEEMMTYLEECVSKSPNLYLYSLGKSPSYGFDIPMVIFTTSDLSKASTLEQAAAICKSNGKLNVQYQAQIHGNEPAGGEGALAMISALASNWGNQYATDLNICVIPRINTEGSYAYTRNQVTKSRNLNRDYLLMEAEEIPMILQAYNLFEPELVVDGHELTSSTDSTSGAFNDVALGTGGNESADPGFEETGRTMILEAFQNLNQNDLTVHFYSGQDDSTDVTTARGYFQMRGSVSLLVETSGIHAGQSSFHRRVVSHFICMETYLDYAVAHSAELRALSHGAKQKLAEEGSEYDENRLFSLTTATVTLPEKYVRTTYNYATGLEKGTKNLTVKSADTVTRSRPLPTAYVIPKDQNSDAILRIIKAHDISYYELEADNAAYLYTYNGSYNDSTKAVTDVSLSAEQLVSFPDGAYVFPMNQDGALILAAMFEPDNDDVYNTSDKTYTLAQKGMVPYENGSFTMYRSQRDLSDGKIEFISAPAAPEGLEVRQQGVFTGEIIGFDPALSYEIRHESESEFSPVAAGSTTVSDVPFGFVEIRLAAKGGVPSSKVTELEILPPENTLPTVYLASANGSDTAFGTKDSPVKTLERAIELLSILRRYSDKKATIVFSETLTITGALQFPAYDFPLYVTSKTGAEGIRSNTNIIFGGETEVDNFTFTHTSNGYSYIVANGHKLTLGKDVKTVAEKDVYYMPVGGGHDTAVESADLTVLAGTWRNIYAGGYKAGVAGDVSLVVKNCTIITHIQNSYSGRTGGNVSFYLENVTMQTSFLCGNANKENVAGDVTLTAKNCTIPLLYAGSRDAGNIQGKVTVTLENCTAGDLYGKGKSESATTAESHLTLIETEPTGEVKYWTFVTQGTPFVKGDLDKDGTVALNDAIYLLYHVNFPSSYPVDQPVDFDNDGEENLNDAIYLLYHVNFSSSYPLH